MDCRLVVSTILPKRSAGRIPRQFCRAGSVASSTQRKVSKAMRNSNWCCTLVVMATLSVALFSTGCRSGGWGMPGSSWVSWGKKKPPTSSIAGTREVPKPPSVSVPPYPASDASSTSSIAGMNNGNPSSTAGRGIANPYATENTATGGYGVQQTTGTEGYATGPYATGRGTAATASTQQGFYSPTYGATGGPAASTADARAGASYPSAGAGYGTNPSPATYGGPTYGGTPSYGSTPAAEYGTPNTANSGYDATGYGATGYGATGYGAGQGYPAMPPAGDYPSLPTNPYPTTPESGAAYPTTGADPYAAPVSAAGGYPNPYNATPATGYDTGSAGYTAPNGYAAPTGYAAPGSYAAPTGYPAGTSGYGTAPTSGAASGYGTSTSSGSSYSTGDQGYRPGSTGRSSDAFGSGSGYTTPASSSPYQGYTR